MDIINKITLNTLSLNIKTHIFGFIGSSLGVQCQISIIIYIYIIIVLKILRRNRRPP